MTVSVRRVWTPKTFVVPLDGSPYSERALPIATALAERIGGSLLLVTTESMGPMGAREYLDEIAARGFPCPVEINTFTDRPAVSAILATVNGADDRVVCMTTHGRGRIAWTVLGSVAEAVTWGSEREMVLVGAHCRSDTPADTAALLIASDAGSSSQGLAAGALTWSDMLGLQRRVAVVVHPLDVESAEHPARIAVPLAGEYGVEPTSIILRRDEYPAGGSSRSPNSCRPR